MRSYTDTYFRPATTGVSGWSIAVALLVFALSAFGYANPRENDNHWRNDAHPWTFDCGPFPGHGHPHHPPPPRHLPPKAPTRLQADALSASEIQLSWRDNSDNETAFEIERARFHHRHSLRWTSVATVDANVTSFTDTGLEPDTAYSYRVRAVNRAGRSSYSNPVRVQTAHQCPNPCGHSIVGWGFYYGHQYGPVPTIANPKAVFASSLGSQSFAILENGKAVNWGFRGQPDSSFPTNLANVVAIASTDAQGLALRENGEIVQWSYYGYPFPVPPPDNLTNVLAITAGYSHFLALKGDGTVVGWGYPPGEGAETPPAGLTNVTAIAAGWYHSLALKKDGTVVAWGSGSFGETNIPANLTDVVAIAAASAHNLALKSDGTIVGWGSFGGNQTPPPALSNIVAIATSDSHSIVLKDDGTVFQWGYAPNMPEGLGGVTSIVAGYGFSLVLTVAPPVPTLPVPLIVNPGQMDLSWQDKSVDELGFKIERSSELGDGQMGPWSQIATVGPGVTNYSDADIVTNGTYWYRLRSFNSCADSIYTEPREIKVAPPVRLEYLSVEPFADTAKLRWYTADARAQGFEIERAPDVAGQPGAWMQIAADSAGAFPSGFADVFDHADTGLTLGTYWYRVRALNVLGVSEFSEPASVTIVPPAAPRSVNAQLGATNEVSLQWWQYPEDEDGFRIERAPDVAGGPGAWTEIAVIDTTTYFFDTNAARNATSWYRVRAFNAVGISDYSEAVSVSISLPFAPGNLWASTYGNEASLYWQQPDGPPAQGYRIERAPDMGGAPGSWTHIGDSSYGYFNDANLAGGVFWYRVQAYNWMGDSPYSDLISVTLESPVVTSTGVLPAILSLTPSDDSLVITWSGTGGSTNFIQARTNVADAFSDITPGIVLDGSGRVTNSYLDIGAITNAPARFYRVRAGQ